MSNITITRGDDRVLTSTVRDATEQVVSLAGAQDVEFVVKRSAADDVPVLTKLLGAGITIPTPANGQILTTLTAADTLSLYGPYVFEIELVDVAGHRTTVDRGLLEVLGGLDAAAPEDDGLLREGDYESIRMLLGVTSLDLSDAVIASGPFQQHAEFRVKQKIEEWETLATDNQSLYILRMATVYGTAALIAETYAKGGFLGLIAPPINTYGEWEEQAKKLWGYFQYWTGEAAALTQPDEADGMGWLSVPMVILAGPHRGVSSSPWVPKPVGPWGFITQEPEVLMTRWVWPQPDENIN